MSGGGSVNNSWTIVTPEETVAETLKPLAGEADNHGNNHTSEPASGENNQPENDTESADAFPVEHDTVMEKSPAKLNGDFNIDQDATEPTAVTDDLITSSLEVSGSFSVHAEDEVNQTQAPPEDTAPVLPEDHTQINPDPDSFSDSYTHVSTSPDEPLPSLLSTETIAGGEYSPEEEQLSQPLNEEEESHQEEEDQSSKTADLGKQADLTTGPEVVENRTEEEKEPELRRRRSLLAALERIGRRTEEEGEEEEFRLPQREDDSGFTVNKCILGAVILLGLGTIFFSGVFMDLDEESDYGTMDLKDAAVQEKQEWLNPEVPPQPVDADSSELLKKLAEGNEEISVLQAQLQAQKEELTVAKGHAAEGAKERLRWEEVEKENSRLKTEMASLPVLQRENERMKRELESIPALQKEVETLRATVTELKLSAAAAKTDEAPVKPDTAPPSGQPEDSRQGTEGSQDGKRWNDQKKRDKHDTGERKEWKGKEKSFSKEGEKREHKDLGKMERKSGKHEYEKEGKQKRQSDETKDWKKDRRGDEGKPWKNREGKKEGGERSERKEWREGKDRKNEKVSEGKKWRGQDESKEWKKEKEWKKMKDGFKEGGKDKWEKKEWKNKNGKDQGKEGKARGERKQWENGKEWARKDERKSHGEHEWKGKDGKQDKHGKRKDERWEQWKNREEEWEKGGRKDTRQDGERKQDRSNHKKKQFTGDHGHKDEHLYGERKPVQTHRKPSMGQPEYWVQKKERLQHSPAPPLQCDSVETCAQAERLVPVTLADFDAILQTYLTKAEEAGVEKSRTDEIRKLIPDFFNDGVFAHDRTSFQDFAEDLGDILEDMVEGEESDGEEEEEEDSAVEDEMEGFEREVMKKFSVAVEKEKKGKGEWRKESGQRRG